MSKERADAGNSAVSFLDGGGELGERMRRKDWSATPLGPPERWPQSLKTAVRIVLTSRQPMFVWWGPQLINLYNDAYKAIVGGKHPQALGQPASEVWREIWDQVRPRAESAMRRNAGTYDEALLLIMERNGYPEETYYTFSYSPIPNDEGGAGGIFCANTDDTQRIIGERQLALLRDLAAAATDSRTVADACERSAQCLRANDFDLPFAMIYLVASDQERMRRAACCGIDPSHPAAQETIARRDAAPWPAWQAIAEHQTLLVRDLSAFGALPWGPWPRPPQQAAVVPIPSSGSQGQAGALVVGLNPFRLFDDNYRRFIELAAGQIASSIASAQAYEDERQRAEALAELDRAKTTFFSNVSHEFRTPLTLLLGPLEDLLSTMEAHGRDAQRRELLTVAHRNGRRLLKLVNTLLDFSRIEAGRVDAVYEPTDLARFTAELASAFRSATDKANLGLEIDCLPLPEPVYVDRDMWEKVVLNLVSNAFKYTLEGEIRVALRAEDDAATLRVRDTGIGIPAAELPKVFHRFHRIHGARGRTHEGTGIGLALVQELVKLHGGTVGVASQEGRGTEFIVRIPFGRAHLPGEKVGGVQQLAPTPVGAELFVDEARRWTPAGSDDSVLNDWTPSTGQSGILLRGARPATPSRVLLVDDNADMRDYVRRLLEAEYEVTTAVDGRDALERIQQQRPDLVLSDVMMPRLDGFGLLAALRSEPQTTHLPVILLSARAGEESRVEGLEAGADDYLVKPFSARELLARVKGTLALAQARREARTREEELRDESAHIVENLTEGFIACDADWTITTVNREAERMTGVLRSAILGRSLWEGFHQAVGATFESAFRSAMADRTPAHVEGFYAPYGKWFEAHAFPVRNGGLAIVFRDITERRQSESALRASEARFSRFMQHLPGLAWIKDEEGRYVFANEAAMRAFGRTEDALYGKTDAQIFPPETARQFQRNDGRALRSEAGIQSEESLRHPDGALRHSIVSKFGIPGDAGQPMLIGGMAIDISERKRAEDSLRESEERFRNMADSAPVMIAVADAEKNAVYFNTAWLAFTGRTLEQVVGDAWVEDLHPEDRERCLQVSSEAFAARRSFSLEQRLRRADGEYGWVLARANPRFTPNGEFAGYIASCVDITEMKRSEQALREADRRKDEFLAMLAHELRNPLAPIRTGLDLLSAQGVKDESIELMRDQVEHLVRMVDDLLDASRILRNRIQLRRKPVELRAVLNRALESVRPHIEAQQHELRIETPDAPVWVDADPVRITQVFANLLHNAAKYTERGGRIEVAISEDAGQAEFRVRDNGIGIAPDLLPKVFDLFTQADRSLERSQGGLGIGLTLVQSLVHLHGGTVSAHSDGEGQGSTFTVRLPAILPAAPDAPIIDAGRAEGEYRILVVDDNIGSAKILARLLRMLGNHEVALAHDGVEAVETARRFHPDLMLLDIGLPRLNGFEAARILRSDPQFDEMLLVALTGYGAEEDRQRSREAGFDMHLIKPPSLDVLQHLFGHPRLKNLRDRA